MSIHNFPEHWKFNPYTGELITQEERDSSILRASASSSTMKLFKTLFGIKGMQFFKKMESLPALMEKNNHLLTQQNKLLEQQTALFRARLKDPDRPHPAQFAD